MKLGQLDTEIEEIFISAENFELAREDLRHFNSRLYYMSDLAPLGATLTLKMAIENHLYKLSLEVMNPRVTLSTVKEHHDLSEAFKMVETQIHEDILEWKKNRFNNDKTINVEPLDTNDLPEK